MKKNKLIFATALLIALATNVKSQTWTKHGTGLSSPSGVCVFDISAPTPMSAWGIFAVFGAGVCGGPAPYYTRTINSNTWVSGLIAELPTDVVPFCISAIDANHAWIATGNYAASTDGYIYNTTNGGSTWQLQPSANSPDIKRFVHFFTPTEGVAVGDSSVFVTTDGGANWIANGGLPIGSSIGGLTRTIFLFNSYEVVGNTIWLGDSYGNFFRSTDMGYTWILLPQSISPSGIKGIAFRDQNYGIAVASSYISGSSSGGGGYADSSVYTTDGGMSWLPMPINFSTEYVDNALAKYDVGFVPGTANTFVVTSEYDTSYAAFSAITLDGGVTWALIDSTEQHTVCTFTGPNSGYTGGYIPNFTQGIYKLTGVLPTAITENTITNNEMLLYPNPASEEINLVLDEKKATKNVVVKIIDYEGKTIIKESTTIHDGKLKMNVSQLPHGIYLFRIQSENSTSNFIDQTIKFSKS